MVPLPTKKRVCLNCAGVFMLNASSCQLSQNGASEPDVALFFLQGKLDPVVGRAKEIDRVIQILGRRTKNNPCLIGEPGVGKTAVAEGLAQKIAAGDVPETIEGKQVVTLDMGLLVAGTKYRGEFEERLKKLMEEIRQNDDIILVCFPSLLCVM